MFKKKKNNNLLIDEPNNYRVVMVWVSYGGRTVDEKVCYESNELGESMNVAYKLKLNNEEGNAFRVEEKVGDSFNVVCTFGYLLKRTKIDNPHSDHLHNMQMEADIAKSARDKYLKLYQKEEEKHDILLTKYYNIELELDKLKGKLKLMLFLEKYTDKMTHEEYNKYQEMLKEFGLKKDEESNE